MTKDAALWATLREHLPRKSWVSIEDIYQIVERNVSLDADDLGCNGVESARPRWKRNVRRLLHSKQKDGTLMSRSSL